MLDVVAVSANALLILITVEDIDLLGKKEVANENPCDNTYQICQ